MVYSMKIEINKISFDIPEPFQLEFILDGNVFVIDGFRRAKCGELVYSFAKNKLVRRGCDSRTPFWIAKLKIKVGNEEILVFDFDSVNLSDVEIDNEETEFEEFEEFEEEKKCLEKRKAKLEISKIKREKQKLELKIEEPGWFNNINSFDYNNLKINYDYYDKIISKHYKNPHEIEYSKINSKNSKIKYVNYTKMDLNYHIEDTNYTKIEIQIP